MEFNVRSARLTDVEPSIRVLERDERGAEVAHTAADILRQLLYLPSETVVVAVMGRTVIGLGVLAIRPSVRIGSFSGLVDELVVVPARELAGGEGVGQRELEARRHRVREALLANLLQSARNKGCTLVEVIDVAVRSDPELWKAAGFERRGARYSRRIL